MIAQKLLLTRPFLLSCVLCSAAVAEAEGIIAGNSGAPNPAPHVRTYYLCAEEDRLGLHSRRHKTVMMQARFRTATQGFHRAHRKSVSGGGSHLPPHRLVFHHEFTPDANLYQLP
jgi:hypothetical protein